MKRKMFLIAFLLYIFTSSTSFGQIKESILEDRYQYFITDTNNVAHFKFETLDQGLTGHFYAGSGKYKKNICGNTFTIKVSSHLKYLESNYTLMTVTEGKSTNVIINVFDIDSIPIESVEVCYTYDNQIKGMLSDGSSLIKITFDSLLYPNFLKIAKFGYSPVNLPVIPFCNVTYFVYLKKEAIFFLDGAKIRVKTKHAERKNEYFVISYTILDEPDICE